MKWIFIFWALISSASASDMFYEPSTLTKAPAPLIITLEKFFKNSDLKPLVHEQGVLDWDLNQIYLKNENTFVLFKFNLTGNFPLNEIIQTDNGFVTHLIFNDIKFALYFQGFSKYSIESKIKNLQNELNQIKTSKFKSFSFFPKAHANENCSSGFGKPIIDSNNISNIENINGSSAWTSVLGCLESVGEGAWDATGGMVKSTVASAWKAVSHPIDTWNKVSSSVSDVFVKLKNFTADFINNPEQTLSKIGGALGETWQKVKGTVLQMSSDQRINFICSFVGNVGISVAISFFTGGSGSLKVAETIAALANKFTITAKLMAKLSKTSSLLSPQKMKSFMSRLMKNKYPDEDLVELESMMAQGEKMEQLGLKALSCSLD